MRPKLTLKKRPDPSTKPKVDPTKVLVANSIGIRFIERDHRYICQKLVVSYNTEASVYFDERCQLSRTYYAELSRTWVDVPLVPEVYVG